MLQSTIAAGFRTAPARAWLLAAPILLAGCDAGVGPTLASRPNPLEGVALHVPFPSAASRQADSWRETRPEDAGAMDRIAREPGALWLVDGDPLPELSATLAATDSAGAVPIVVAYFVPYRDCSTGGAADARTYRDWIGAIAGALSGRRSVVILEPDALAQLDCHGASGEARLQLLAHAVDVLRAAGATVYIDAGHPHWLPVGVAADRLRGAGVERADGFALNVSNFVATEVVVDYGRAIAARLGPTGFVIDTGRSGAGAAPDLEWCNPPGRRLGTSPTTRAGYAGVDALLWIKPPGESDGPCNGGPPAGEWWAEYALELAR